MPVRAARRTAATSSRAVRSPAGRSESARSSSICRSTRALCCSPGALDLGRPAATKTVTWSRSSARECARESASRVWALSVTRLWESLRSPEAATTLGAPAPATAAATTATATISRLRTCVGRPLPTDSEEAPSCAGGVCLPGRRGRVFCTGARIPDSSTKGPDDVPSRGRVVPVRLPTLPVALGSGPTSPGPPPEGVNPGGELAGKFLRRVPRRCTAGRLDVGAVLWHYSPPRFTGSRQSVPNPAAGAEVRARPAANDGLL